MCELPGEVEGGVEGVVGWDCGFWMAEVRMVIGGERGGNIWVWRGCG